MKSWIQATAFLLAGASALVIPYSVRTLAKDIKLVAGSTGPDHVSIFFKSPCLGCASYPDVEIDYNLRIESTLATCDASRISINHVSLLPAESGSNSSGTVILKSSATGLGFANHEIVAEWNLICHEEVSFLLLNVVSILDDPEHTPQSSGFTVGFRQQNPVITSLKDRPFDAATLGGDINSLVKHKARPDLIVEPSSLDEELQGLRKIEKSLQELSTQYKEQESKIASLVSQEIDQCHGSKCLLRGITKTAPDMLTLVREHFIQTQSDRNHEEKVLDLDSEDKNLQIADAASHDELDEFNQVTPESFSFDHPPPPPPPGPEPFSFGHPPPPPPPPHGVPEDGPPRFDRPPHHNGGEHHHHGPPPWVASSGHRPPHFGPRHHRHLNQLLLSIEAILLLIVVAACAFVYVRRNTTLFGDPARRRDRAARREELSTRVAYRRAACRYRWDQWWSQFRQPESTSDYEEKRARIVQQEGDLEDVMQNEINQLHRAHEIVQDMLRAEEERQRLHHEANFTPGTFIEIGEGSGARSGRMMATLPPYTRSQPYPQLPDDPPPPSYEEDLEGEMTVVDGFRYTPEGTESTPDSSVVDCESRLSFDTDSTRTDK